MGGPSIQQKCPYKTHKKTHTEKEPVESEAGDWSDVGHRHGCPRPPSAGGHMGQVSPESLQEEPALPTP